MHPPSLGRKRCVSDRGDEQRKNGRSEDAHRRSDERQAVANENIEPQEQTRRYGSAALVGALLVALVLAGITLAPVLPPVLLGALLAGFAASLQHRIERRFPHKSAVAALLTLAMFLMVLLPIGLTLGLVIDRLNQLLAGDALRHFFGASGAWQQLLAEHPWLQRVLPNQVGDELASALRWLGNAIPGILAGVADTGLALFLAVITTYFLLRDGRWIYPRLEHALPLDPAHTRAIVAEFARVGRAVIIGTVGTALIQGALAGVAYWVLALPQALLLGALTGIVSIVPVVGTALVWVPAAVYLLVTGHVVKGVLLLAIGALLVGTVDNLVRPLLTRGGLEVHPLLVFLGIFGGLAVFGISGLYLGPLFVTLFMAVAHIYERDVAPATLNAADTGDGGDGPAQTLSRWRSVARNLGRARRR